MTEFLHLLPPADARTLLMTSLGNTEFAVETIDTFQALGRITAEDIRAPHPLPNFQRSTVDGFAVRARDTFGASDSLPTYLTLFGEVPMGSSPDFVLKPMHAALIHTGGMLPMGADAVVMLEYSQLARVGEIELQKSVAEGENVILIGEDVAQDQVVLPRGIRIRPAEIGGLMALGLTVLRVIKKPRVGLISSGDEVRPPTDIIQPGQVRDINSYTLAALVTQVGGEAILYGIVPDQFEKLKEIAAQALRECDVVIITAGSSASVRDITADVIASLGEPGILVHGINTRPGKPTILAVCNGKAVIGLPGNPVSALVNGYLFVAPVIEKLLCLPEGKPRPSVNAVLTVNLASRAGREDWWPVRLVPSKNAGIKSFRAEPIFGKSNLIFTLAMADGLVAIPPDATGLTAGEKVEVILI